MPEGRLHPGDELHLGAFQDTCVIGYEGICLANWEPGHRDRALRLVERFLAYQPEGPRHARMDHIARHLDETWFCWISGTSDGKPFYYRLQSPVIMVEFDHHAGIFLANPEPERFHIHTLVRTPNGNDYGAAFLSRLTGVPHRLDGPA